jgi:hypothetical protein
MARLAADTPAEVEERQIQAWREMSPADKAALVAGLTNATYALARAALRERHPGDRSGMRERADRSSRGGLERLAGVGRARGGAHQRIDESGLRRALRERSIIRVQGQPLDRAYLREHAPMLGIEALLIDALKEGEGA